MLFAPADALASALHSPSLSVAVGEVAAHRTHRYRHQRHHQATTHNHHKQPTTHKREDSQLIRMQGQENHGHAN